MHKTINEIVNEANINTTKRFEELVLKYPYIKRRICTVDRYSLYNVNPFSDNLTGDVKERVIKECKSNIWYFITEICRIPDHNMRFKMLELNPHNIGMVACYDNNIDSYSVTPRIIGRRSITSLVICLYDMLFHKNRTYLINKSSLNARSYELIMGMYVLLPDYIKNKFKVRDSLITIPHGDNGCYINSHARGICSGICLLTDLEYLSVPLSSAIKIIKSNMRLTKNNGDTACIIMESCENKYNKNRDITKTTEYVINGALVWTPELFELMYKRKDMFDGILKANSSNGIVYIEHNYPELVDDIEEYELHIKESPKTLKNELSVNNRKGGIK